MIQLQFPVFLLIIRSIHYLLGINSLINDFINSLISSGTLVGQWELVSVVIGLTIFTHISLPTCWFLQKKKEIKPKKSPISKLFYCLGLWNQTGGVLLMGYELYRILAMSTPCMASNKCAPPKKKKSASANSNTSSQEPEVIDLEEEEKNMDFLIGEWEEVLVLNTLLPQNY